MEIRQLTDPELLARLCALAAQERESVADVIEHISELDRRANVAKTGCATLFEYCRRKLGYSEQAAYVRIRAARAIRSIPRLLGDLRSGAIHLDAVARLAPHLTPENAEGIITLASGASKTEVMTLAAKLGGEGHEPERDVIRPLAASPAAQAAGVPSGAAFAHAEVIPPPDRVRIAFTADGELLKMLQRLKSIRRHKFPSGRLEDLIKEAVGRWLSCLTPKAVRSRDPGKPAIRRRSRRIPAAVKAAVWERDAGRCVFVAPDGTRCGRPDYIQFDHIVPWSSGGPSTLENVRLLCRSHNLWRARERFGPRQRKRGLLCPDIAAHGAGLPGSGAGGSADGLQ